MALSELWVASRERKTGEVQPWRIVGFAAEGLQGMEMRTLLLEEETLLL